MVTRDQALDYGISEFHLNGCTRTVGPRGGETIKIVRVRRNGRVQTWKTRPEDFSMPVKYGLRDAFRIGNLTAERWHAPSECPLHEEV